MCWVQLVQVPRGVCVCCVCRRCVFIMGGDGLWVMGGYDGCLWVCKLWVYVYADGCLWVCKLWVYVYADVCVLLFS
jgi:hypothetical protein